MHNMDQEKAKRAQSLKVIVSEAIMVVAVIITVIVLALIVSGYWLNSDFKVERQGLLQISSIPTGATVDIDGDSDWLQRTNTSKVLSRGQHTISLSKEGYDTWSRTIDIREGLLYRVHYPRLFLKDRKIEKTIDLTSVGYSVVSPNHNTVLITNLTTEWQALSLDEEKATSQKIDISKLSSFVSVPEEGPASFIGHIEKANWAKDNAHILLKTLNNDEVEWLLLNIDNVDKSINLSKEFAAKFDDVQIVNDSANSLLVLQDQNMRKIDVANKQISAILIENVVSFDHYENEIIAVAKVADAEEYSLQSLNLGDNKTIALDKLSNPAQVTISRFYDDKYITLLNGAQVNLYKETDFEPVADFELNFVPEYIKVGHDGEFITMYAGANIATLDMEAQAIAEWQIESANFGWIDNDMIYVIHDENLIVYDFDGLNRRVISTKVSDTFPVTITEDKWLYYCSSGQLMREWLIPR